MSETPRTDAVFASTDHAGIMFDFARTLERELAAATKERDRLSILCGEIIATVRVNVMRGSLRVEPENEQNREQLQRLIDGWSERLASK